MGCTFFNGITYSHVEYQKTGHLAKLIPTFDARGGSTGVGK